MNINFNGPFNTVSFGQVSAALMRGAFKNQDELCVFPIGNVDVSAQKIDKPFGQWLENAVNTAVPRFSRNDKTIKLWHINGGLESFGREQSLLTFHETDSLTELENKILSCQQEVLVTSNHTKRVFEEAGLKSVRYIELGFDHDNFYPTERKLKTPGVVVFGIFGKLEYRKAHEKAIRAWVKRFGNNANYRLHAAIYNTHFTSEQMNGALNQLFEGKQYWNVTIVPPVKTNAEYNDVLNNIDIVIGCSRAEGRDLPVFHAVGLGKHCVGLNAHAYKDYLTSENATLIEATGLVPAVDNVFFHKGAPFNQGNFYDWDEDDFIGACQVAVTKYNSNSMNTNGLQLQQKSYQETWKSIIAGV